MKLLGTASLVLISAAAPLLAQNQEEKKESLNTVIRDWIDLSRQIETVENKWEEDRAILTSYRDSLKQQVEIYRKDIEAEKPFIKEREEILKEKKQELADYETANAVITEQLPALEDQALTTAKLLPDLVSQNPEVREAIAKLTGQVESRAKDDFKPERDLNNRLVAVLTILREAEKFQNKVTIKTEDGDDSTFETIYFGLGQAYRIESTGERAWIGRVVDGAFTFVPADEMAEDIRKLIAVANEEEEAQMIGVPTKVQ